MPPWGASRGESDVRDLAMAGWQSSDKQKFIRHSYTDDNNGTVTFGEFEYKEEYKVRFNLPVVHSRTQQFVRKYIMDLLPNTMQELLLLVDPSWRKPDFLPQYREFAIYKGMDVQEFRYILARAFYEHDLADFKTKDGEWGNHSVPSHFISPDGTHYPLSLLSIDPAMFGRATDTGVVYDLPMNWKIATFTWPGQRWPLWRRFYTDVIWKSPLGKLLTLVFWIEMLALLSVYLPGLGPEGWLGSLVVLALSKIDLVKTYFIYNPLKHVYRNGPSFQVPILGEIGFWGGRPIGDACAHWSSTAKLDFWNTPALETVCGNMFADKEHQFAECTFYLTLFVYFYAWWFSRDLLECVLGERPSRKDKKK